MSRFEIRISPNIFRKRKERNKKDKIGIPCMEVVATAEARQRILPLGTEEEKATRPVPSWPGPRLGVKAESRLRDKGPGQGPPEVPLRPGPRRSPARRLPPHTAYHLSAPVWLWLLLGFPYPLWSSVFRVSFFPPPVLSAHLNIKPLTKDASTFIDTFDSSCVREAAETATRVSVTTSTYKQQRGFRASFKAPLLPPDRRQS